MAMAIPTKLIKFPKLIVIDQKFSSTGGPEFTQTPVGSDFLYTGKQAYVAAVQKKIFYFAAP
jgi:hypothetical protein